MTQMPYAIKTRMMRMRTKRRCDDCGTIIRYGSTRCRPCEDIHRRAANQFICRNCKEIYSRKRTGNEGKTFCSRECAFKFKVGENHHHWKSDRPQPKPKLEKACVSCGNLTVRPKYCSKKCSKYVGYQNYLMSCAIKKAVIQYKCLCCHLVFIPKYRDKRKQFCSKKCMLKFYRKERPRNHRTRVKKYNVQYESFNLTKIFERDKWRCQLCGIRTPKRLKGSFVNNAPELDHIIPISIGGSHTWDNVQCACRGCNGLKSNKALGQLRLLLGQSKQ